MFTTEQNIAFLMKRFEYIDSAIRKDLDDYKNFYAKKLIEFEVRLQKLEEQKMLTHRNDIRTAQGRECLKEFVQEMLDRGIIKTTEGLSYTTIFDFAEQNLEVCTCEKKKEE